MAGETSTEGIIERSIVIGRKNRDASKRFQSMNKVVCLEIRIAIIGRLHPERLANSASASSNSKTMWPLYQSSVFQLAGPAAAAATTATAAVLPVIE
jgi:hypothetical protein